MITEVVVEHPRRPVGDGPIQLPRNDWCGRSEFLHVRGNAGYVGPTCRAACEAGQLGFLADADRQVSFSREANEARRIHEEHRAVAVLVGEGGGVYCQAAHRHPEQADVVVIHHRQALQVLQPVKCAEPVWRRHCERPNSRRVRPAVVVPVHVEDHIASARQFKGGVGHVLFGVVEAMGRQNGGGLVILINPVWYPQVRTVRGAIRPVERDGVNCRVCAA